MKLHYGSDFHLLPNIQAYFYMFAAPCLERVFIWLRRWKYSGLRWNVSVTVPLTTHTCSVTLMEMTELQESLEVSGLSAPLPLGNICNPALRKCHYWFVSVRRQHSTARPLEEHNLYTAVYLSRCMPSFPCAYLEIQTLQPWFFNQPDHTLLCAEMLKLWVHTRLEASLWSFPQIRWWWPLKSGFMNWEKHQIRERGGGRILQCFISSNIFQGWYSPFFFFYGVASVECWTRGDKRILLSSSIDLAK